MDIPVSLLKKNLPKQKSGGQYVEPEPAPAQDVDSEAAFFVQAMQGMVVKNPAKKHSKAGTAGHFSLQDQGAFKNMPQSTQAREAAAKGSPSLADSAMARAMGETPVAPLAPVAPALGGKKRAAASKSVKKLSADPLPGQGPTPSAPLFADQQSQEPSAEQSAEQDFALAMRTVKALKGKGREVMPEVLPTDLAQVMSLQDMLDGEVVFDVALHGEDIQGHVVGLDEASVRKLVNGEYSPEARLDLHGLNALQAFQALLPFMRSAWNKGLRAVIVVTGRGLNSLNGMGVLRDKVQSWLTQEPFKRIVIAFSTARPADGGTGSMYILLRKCRKKHKVYWERTPADSDLF